MNKLVCTGTSQGLKGGSSMCLVPRSLTLRPTSLTWALTSSWTWPMWAQSPMEGSSRSGFTGCWSWWLHSEWTTKWRLLQPLLHANMSHSIILDMSSLTVIYYQLLVLRVFIMINDCCWCCCRDIGGQPHYNFTKLDQLIELLWINGLRPGTVPWLQLENVTSCLWCIFKVLLCK